MAEYVYIDEVSVRTGLTPRTIRFWEEKGLMPPPARTEGGIRLYSEADIARCLRIRELRDLLGLSLAVIRDLLRTEDELDQLRAQARQQSVRADRAPFLRQAVEVLEEQVSEIADRIDRLQALREVYGQRLSRLKHRLEEITE